MITVACAECAKKLGRPVRSEFPDRDGAQAFVRRHHALVGHRAEILEEPVIVYIAGPMTGIPEFNYPLFNATAKALRAAGVEVRNPAENDGGSAGESWEFYMRLALRSLLECDEIVLLPGWRDSRGARLEEAVARELGMRVREFDLEAM